MIAICSALKKALIAVEINGKNAMVELDEKTKHSENILPKIDELLQSISCSIKDNESFAVVIGPGSFTGLRVGVSVVKGLCAGDEKIVYPLSTLSLKAYSYCKQNTPQENFCAVINALSGFFFVCEFDKYGNALDIERLVTKDELDKINLKKVSLEEERLFEDIVSIQASDLLTYAKAVQKQGNGIKAKSVVPIYLRKSQAEANLEEKKLKNS